MPYESYKIQVIEILHRDTVEDEKGTSHRIFFSARVPDQPEPILAYVKGNENVGKWVKPSTQFFGNISEKEPVTSSKGVFSRAWRDWNLNAKGEPRETQARHLAAGSGTVLPVEAASATFDALVRAYGEPKATALFAKLDIRVAFSQQASSPTGYTQSDDEIPF